MAWLSENGRRLLERWTLLAGGVEMAIGAAMAAFPDVFPTWVAFLALAIALVTIGIGLILVWSDISKLAAAIHVNPVWVGALIAAGGLVMILGVAVSYFLQAPAGTFSRSPIPLLLVAVILVAVFLTVGNRSVARALPSHQRPDPAPQGDTETGRDIQQLLNFAVDHATAMVLEDLICCAPTLDAEEPIKAGHMSATERSAFDYIQKVKGQIPTDHRRSSLLSILQFAEHAAEDEIRKTPPEQRPVDVDPLDLRRRTILFTQVERTVAFLDHQKAEVEERMRGQRSGLIERMELRNH